MHVDVLRLMQALVYFIMQFRLFRLSSSSCVAQYDGLSRSTNSLRMLRLALSLANLSPLSVRSADLPGQAAPYFFNGLGAMPGMTITRQLHADRRRHCRGRGRIRRVVVMVMVMVIRERLFCVCDCVCGSNETNFGLYQKVAFLRQEPRRKIVVATLQNGEDGFGDLHTVLAFVDKAGDGRRHGLRDAHHNSRCIAAAISISVSTMAVHLHRSGQVPTPGTRLAKCHDSIRNGLGRRHQFILPVPIGTRSLPLRNPFR
mmetsp:Transcript_19155/g.53350  ORF Transcript_19155/g.53350 Transcript_19155/m.53350 type:complete len:258 (+) Transcript_19155:44-817(+)